MRKNLILFYIVTLSLSPFVTLASPGRTDANGCHTEKKTGNHHCHSTPVAKQAKTTARQDARNSAKATAKDINCSDFNTQLSAQEFFIDQGGPTADRYQLDGDKDDIACEDLP